MPRIEEAIVIPLGLLETWELMRNLELRPRWDATIIRVRRGVVSPDAEGPRLYYLAPLFLGLRWRWEGEYISFQPPNRTAVRMAWGSSLRPFKSLVGTWVLQSQRDGTQVRMIVSFEPRWPLPLLGKIMGYRMRRLLGKSLLKLRVLGTGNHSSPDRIHR